MSRQVTCINKRDHQSAHERITHIGGTGWRMTENDAIRAIESNADSFWVSVQSQLVDVIVASHQGRKYLKTRNDGYAPNNLLNLPECR